MFKPLLALSAFCSKAVPTYSTRSQNTKFISLSRSLPACRNLQFDFFYTLTRIQFGLNTGFILSESFPVITRCYSLTALEKAIKRTQIIKTARKCYFGY